MHPIKSVCEPTNTAADEASALAATAQLARTLPRPGLVPHCEAGWAATGLYSAALPPLLLSCALQCALVSAVAAMAMPWCTDQYVARVKQRGPRGHIAAEGTVDYKRHKQPASAQLVGSKNASVSGYAVRRARWVGAKCTGHGAHARGRRMAQLYCCARAQACEPAPVRFCAGRLTPQLHLRPRLDRLCMWGGQQI